MPGSERPTNTAARRYPESPGFSHGEGQGRYMRPHHSMPRPYERKCPMSSTGFDPASERSMIEHMNTDHVDSNLMYVKVYGNLWEATAARLVALDKEGMDLEVTVPDGTQRLHIAF